MVTRRRKKVVKYRGSVTHGGGSRKKRRGAGSRGGRGNAGTGKRAGQKKAGMPLQLGRRGFTSKHTHNEKVINVGDLTEAKVAALGGQKEVLDLGKAGYTKLLGAGTTPLKLTITVASHSVKAKEKITAVGGSLIRSTAAKDNKD